MGNSIGSNGLTAISRALRHVPELLTLRLSKNMLGTQGMLALGSGLHHIPKIGELSLDNTFMNDDGAIALAAGIKQIPNPADLEVYLNDNRIGDRGAIAIADAIAHNDAHYIELYNNNIG